MKNEDRTRQNAFLVETSNISDLLHEYLAGLLINVKLNQSPACMQVIDVYIGFLLKSNISSKTKHFALWGDSPIYGDIWNHSAGG